MAYSIYWYIKNEEFKRANRAQVPDELRELSRSPVFKRAKELLYSKDPGDEPVFGWIKPRELPTLRMWVKLLERVSPHLVEVTDSNYIDNPLSIEFWELIEKSEDLKPIAKRE